MNAPGLAVLAWGGGWAVACLLLPVSAHTIDWSSSAAVFAAAIVVGAPLLGVPNYVTARQGGAKYPGIEATLWVLLLAVVVAVVARVVVPPITSVNVVTAEEFRRRQHGLGGTWPYPPELVGGVLGMAVFCVLAACSSVVVNGSGRSLFARVLRAGLFSIALAIALGVAALFFAVPGPLVWRLIPLDFVNVAAAAFLAGCLAGVGIVTARRTCLP